MQKCPPLSIGCALFSAWEIARLTPEVTSDEVDVLAEETTWRPWSTTASVFVPPTSTPTRTLAMVDI